MGIFCCFPDPVDFDGDVNLFHFEMHRAVGKGAFGKVRVVQHKKSKKLYALKYIEKEKCTKQKAVGNILQERQLLEEVDHPFVVNLRYAFQDDQNCFFVLDLMLGGDLRFHLEKNGRIEEKCVRFWVAELSCALAYLHKQGIMHRDIKPDNVLLDTEGHAHVTDFNVAIHYSRSRLHTSVAGSLAYMAPEVCSRKGYSWQADWWSLGVCSYELLFGRRPFEGKTADSLTAAVAKDSLRFPERASEVCSAEGIQVIKQLLDKNPKKRLGCTPETDDEMAVVRSHPWFARLDWDALEDKELQAPFVPDLKKANFDISHELDEFLMVEKPLSAKKRKENVDINSLSPELRQLEEQFTIFDYTKPRRISYYPANQSLSLALTKSLDRDGSLDGPRSSTQSYSLTLVPDGNNSGDDSSSRAGSPSLAKPHQLFMPIPPEQAHVRNSTSSRQEAIGVAITSDSHPLTPR
ncbi:kinase-like protein [Schizopora paradoxa]|uniref:Kinase-like protein n=1 Tax=Schizopora paradoxa TaxID=27342 RepID=A0A0H2RYG3_9AGAM|nr:kinase-like protein [Schizopora paradoxa]